ncbi:LOW QUALITY PROTEIN: uncharacterized protein LOC129585406 [Paramacrobiotus metropolitanus]|uniref:LOW QUALITY PROTEIN: uncharacterized protein LOC129585406 n=1 Tax=Paramacrobiotus metropolitanus TaxID=2943436 RepID=UPI002445680B|nr:LOW QUALITY PROTEIN: uncharacterized protein LOC129585406 [Paramacrobiotus metropolitanus]
MAAFIKFTDGDIAGAVIGSILCTLVLTCCGFFAWYWFYMRKRDGKIDFEDASRPGYRVNMGASNVTRKHLITDADVGVGRKHHGPTKAYVNAGFQDPDDGLHLVYQQKQHKGHKNQNRTKDGGERTRDHTGNAQTAPAGAVRTQSTLHQRVPQKFHSKKDRVKVKLRGHDFTGLGFNICGNLRDGIYVQNVLQKGPAAESGLLEPGDRIMDVEVSFKNIVFEDALTILSYASPYDVTLAVKKYDFTRSSAASSSSASAKFSRRSSSLQARSTPAAAGQFFDGMSFPLKRSQSIGDLDQIAKRDSYSSVESNSTVSRNAGPQHSNLQPASARQARDTSPQSAVSSVRNLQQSSPASSIRHIVTRPGHYTNGTANGHGTWHSRDSSTSNSLLQRHETPKGLSEETVTFSRIGSPKKRAPPPPPSPPQLPTPSPPHMARPFSSVSTSSSSGIHRQSRTMRSRVDEDERRSYEESSMVKEIFRELQDHDRSPAKRIVDPQGKRPLREYQTFEMVWTEGSESETSSVLEKNTDNHTHRNVTRHESAFPASDHTYVRQVYTTYSHPITHPADHDEEAYSPRSPHFIQTSGGSKLILPVNMEPTPSVSTPTSFTSDEESGPSPQLCSSPNGLGKCSSNVFTCVFQNGYPYYFKDNSSFGDCSHDEFCCVNLPIPEDGSCSQRCGISGTARQKQNVAESGIKLDKNYDWDLMLQAQERSSRIVNGSDADKYEFCWQGGVFIVDTDQLQNNSATTTPIFIGGASLVAQDMALTAAHVLQPFITDANFIIFMAFGFRNISDVTNIMNASANWDEIPVFRVPNEMAFHSGYNDRTYENNIAIIRFNPISCDNANLCPICLSPTPVNPFQPWKGTCYASGWGATNDASVAPILQKQEMSIPYPQECLKSFFKLGLKNYDLPTTMLCADAINQNGGTCDRDGGSPLVCQTKYGNWELSGIVGVGVNRCRQVGAPTLFTNVGYYYDWISSYSKGTYKEDATTPPTSYWTTPASLNDTTTANQSDTVTTDTPTTLSTAATTLTTSSSKPFRFQFNTPKVFIPKQTVYIDPQQKLAQAFFQERADKPTDSVRTAATTTVAATVAPTTEVSTMRSLFSILVGGEGDSSKSTEVSKNSSAIRLFFRPEMGGVFRRKVTDASINNSSTIAVSVATNPTTQATTSTKPSTTVSSSTALTAAAASATTATKNSVTSASTVPATTSAVASLATTSSQDTKESPASVNEVPTAPLLKPLSNSGSGRKVVVFIRPEENTSILKFLRRRYKDSQMYTDATTAASVAKFATSTASTSLLLNTTAVIPSTTANITSVITNTTEALKTNTTISTTTIASTSSRRLLTFAPKVTVASSTTVAPAAANTTISNAPVNVTVTSNRLLWNVTRPRDPSIMF